MKTKKHSETRKLNKQICLRLPPTTYDLVDKEAQERNLSLASHIRDILIDRYGQDKSALFHTVNRGHLPSEDILAIRALRESTAQLCGALVQNAIRFRQDGDIQKHADAEDIIQQLRPLVRDLDDIRDKLRKHL